MVGAVHRLFLSSNTLCTEALFFFLFFFSTVATVSSVKLNSQFILFALRI